MKTMINKDLISTLHPCKDRFDNYLNFYSEKSHTKAQFLGLKNITQDDKMWVAFRLMPKENIVLAAADIAELVLPIYEKAYPNDNRPRAAIEAARKGDKDDSTRAAANAAAYATAYAAYADAYDANATYHAAANYAAAAAAAEAAANAAYADAYDADGTYHAAAKAAANAAAAAANAAYAAADAANAAAYAANGAAYATAYADAYSSVAYTVHASGSKTKAIRAIVLKYWKDKK